jgi:hypothetical protein
VPRAGLEPARPHGQQILSLARLPFRHPGSVPAQDLERSLEIIRAKLVRVNPWAAFSLRGIRLWLVR